MVLLWEEILLVESEWLGFRVHERRNAHAQLVKRVDRRATGATSTNDEPSRAFIHPVALA